MNEFPKTLEILGTTWQMKYTKETHLDEEQPERPFDGLCAFDTGEIRICTSTGPEDHIWKSVYHEMFEAIARELELHLAGDKYHSELELLSITVYDTLKRNGMLK